MKLATPILVTECVFCSASLNYKNYVIPIIQLVAFFHQFYYCDLCFLRIDSSNPRLSTLRELFFAIRVEDENTKIQVFLMSSPDWSHNSNLILGVIFPPKNGARFKR